MGLIPRETAALVGQRLGAPVSATIHAHDAERFAYAAGDTNPIYLDEAAARAAGHRTRVAPPGFLVWALEPPRPLEALREDGLWRDAGPPIRLHVSRVLYAGEEWEYGVALHVGDTITAETRLASLEEKTGGSGAFVLATTETTYTNQANEVVAIARGAKDRAMSEERFADDVKPGDVLPPLVKNASRAQLFLFSAATRNPHRIHYDRDYAKVEGHEDILVHGPLQGAWLHQFVQGWAGPRGRVLALAFQNRGRAFPERDLTFHGRVTEVDGDVAALEVWEQDESGAVLMPGTARVRLPRRGAQ